MFMHQDIVRPALEIAWEFFQLEFPLRMEDLKQRYVAEVLRFQRDWSNDHSRETRRLARSYVHLASQLGKGPGIFAYDEESRSKIFPQTTVEGTPLYALGLGLPHNVAKKKCDKGCSGHGYTAHYDRNVLLSCDSCFGVGYNSKTYPCYACKETGIYTQDCGRTVTCRVCDGTRVIRHPTRMERCEECCNKKKVKVVVREGEECVKKILVEDKTSEHYHDCFNCGGHGEIEVPRNSSNFGRATPVDDMRILLCA